MKRDSEYQIELLKKLEDDEGSFHVANYPTYGMNEGRIKEWHHLQLLVDEGLVVKRNRTSYRLTSKGHDAL